VQWQGVWSRRKANKIEWRNVSRVYRTCPLTLRYKFGTKPGVNAPTQNIKAIGDRIEVISVYTKEGEVEPITEAILDFITPPLLGRPMGVSIVLHSKYSGWWSASAMVKSTCACRQNLKSCGDMPLPSIGRISAKRILQILERSIPLTRPSCEDWLLLHIRQEGV
jgi:hypothetical protein